MFDLHPKHVMTDQQNLGLGLSQGTTWNWGINCASVGSATSRVRSVWTWVSSNFGNTPSQVPLLLDVIFLPSFIGEFTQAPQLNQVVPGQTMLHEPNVTDVNQPSLLGKIELDTSRNRVGLNILYNNDKGVITQIHQDGLVTAKFGNMSLQLNPKFFTRTKTIFQIYSIEGVAFSFGINFLPAGHGHTLVWDPSGGNVRSLSTLECWLISGGTLSEFPHLQLTEGDYTTLFTSHNPLEFANYQFSLVLGLLNYKFLGVLEKMRTGKSDVSLYPHSILKRCPRENTHEI